MSNLTTLRTVAEHTLRIDKRARGNAALRNGESCVCCGAPIPEGRMVCLLCGRNPFGTAEREREQR